MQRLLFSLALVLNFTFPAFADVTTGQPAPDFTLTDGSGQKHVLSQYKRQFMVLEWYNPDCPFVKKHYDSKNMQTLQKMYTEKGVVWLTIDSSAPGKEGHYPAGELKRLMESKGGRPTAVFTDSDGTVGKLYGAKTTPHMFVIDPQGVLIYQGAIDSEPGTDQEDIAKAQNYVQSALDEAMAGKPVTTVSTKSYGCSVKY